MYLLFFCPWQNFEARSVYQQKGNEKTVPQCHKNPPKEKYGPNVNGKLGAEIFHSTWCNCFFFPIPSMGLEYLPYIYHYEINEIHVGKNIPIPWILNGFLFGIPFHHWFFEAQFVEFLDLTHPGISRWLRATPWPTAAEAEFALGFLRRSWRIVRRTCFGDRWVWGETQLEDTLSQTGLHGITRWGNLVGFSNMKLICSPRKIGERCESPMLTGIFFFKDWGLASLWTPNFGWLRVRRPPKTWSKL